MSQLAEQKKRNISDVRHSSESFVVGTGSKRNGKRLLAVGTDCSCGKMYTTLAIEKEMLARGIDCMTSAPIFGEDTRNTLIDIGYSDQEIDNLFQEKIIFDSWPHGNTMLPV